jgi:trk system potassium uptake protein TrkH
MRSILAVLNVLGALLALFAAYYVLPIGTALIYGETASLRVFVGCAAATLIAGLLLLLVTRKFRAELKPRDGYLLVSLSWLLVTAAAAIPLMWGERMHVRAVNHRINCDCWA